ncbi:MFS transporter [Streptomyces canarius]
MALISPTALHTTITLCAALQCVGLAFAVTRGTRSRPRRARHRK